MSAGDRGEKKGADDDVALASTMASDDVALASTMASEKPKPAAIPRTLDANGRPREADPAFAATMTPEALSQRTTPTAWRTSEHATLTAEHPGRYEAKNELGRGGMGRVLVVKDAHLGREVALKELLGQGAAEAAGLSVGTAARFLREARITGQLEHPGIVPVHELGMRADGTLYYTMKRIRGRSLADVLKEKTSLVERLTLLRVFSGVCEAIAYAHSRGVVHRDLKPDNVMVGEYGDTLVVDWGLAKVKGESEVRAASRPPGTESIPAIVSGDHARTLDGHALGTPSYMSPEQARGDLAAIDERTDVWGLGAILFELLTGRPPYVGTSALDVLSQIHERPAPSVRSLVPDAPPELAAIADRALMRDASSRYPSATELAKEINNYLDGKAVGAYEYSAWELVLRFVRRHRAASIAAASIVASIVIASIVVYQSFLEESRARAIAEQARDEAMTERGHAMTSMHEAESAVADALLEHADRALFDGDPTGAAIYAAGVLARTESSPAEESARLRRVRALAIYIEADDRRRFVVERTVPGAHARGMLSIDGSTLAIPTETNLRVVELDGGTERHVPVHASRVWALNDRGIAVLSGDAHGVYDLASGERVHDCPEPTFASASEAGIAITAGDGSVLVLGPDGRTVLGQWTSARRGAVRVALAPDGGRVAVFASDSPDVELWTLPPAGAAHVVSLSALPYGAAFSPAGERLAVVGSDLVARISFTPTPSTIELPVDTWPTAIAWPRADGDEGLLALYENTERVSLREPEQGHVVDVVHLPPASGGRLVAGGERVALLPTEGHSAIGYAVVMRRASGGGFESVRLPGGVRDVALDTARRRVVVATLTSVWSVPITGAAGLMAATHLADMPEGVGIVQRLLALGDGSVAIVSLRGALLYARPPDYALEIVRPAPEASFASALVGAAVSPDGHDLYTGAAQDGRVLRWSVPDHAEGAALEGGDDTVSALAVSADGTRLASGARDGTLRVWNLATRTVERTVQLGSSPLTALVFSPRGDRVACGDQTGALRVVTVAAGTPTREAHPHTRWINGLSWSADARWIVSTSDDRSVAVLAESTLEPVRIVRTSAAPISAALMNDGTHLVYHDGRDVIRLDLRMSMETPDGAALLDQAETRAGMRLEGLVLVPR